MTYISSHLWQEVIERAGNCCEYCRVSQDFYPFTFHIEHIISEKHRGETISENLAWSCPTCNTNKGSDIASDDPDTGKITRLYNPRTQEWDMHFHINLETTQIEAFTAEGRVTVFVLQMNSEEQIDARRMMIDMNLYPCKKVDE